MKLRPTLVSYTLEGRAMWGLLYDPVLGLLCYLGRRVVILDWRGAETPRIQWQR